MQQKLINSSRVAFAKPYRPQNARRRSPTIIVRADLTDIINDLTISIQKNSILSDGKKAFAKFQAGNYDKDKISSQIDSLINDNPIVIFSFTTCPFCIRAKQLFDDLGVKYTTVECNEHPDGMAFRAELAERTSRTSMPNIFIGGQGIGGFNDGTPGLKPLSNSGELTTMLKNVGALAP